MSKVITGGGVIIDNGVILNLGGVISNRGGVILTSGLDPDAAAYIAAVEAQGATVDSTQALAIDNFYVTAKATGYYTSLKRLYLPIWGITAANAICMITLSSGTFVGGVTHGAGYVQGDGATGYFDVGSTFSGVGIATGSASIFTLVKSGVADNSYSGARDVSDFGVMVGTAVGSLLGRAPSGASQFFTAITGTSGIFLMTQTATAARALYRRLTSGFSTVDSNTISDPTALPVLNPYFAGALNTSGAPQFFHGAQYGAYGLGVGLDLTESTNFSLSLKNLWETTTGLTLP